MKNSVNVEERKPIWVALSEFYLDTELQESDFRYVAREIIASPYTLEEVKTIDKYEVFPVLHPNLVSVAGEWAGFREDWLVEEITASLNNRTALNRIGIEVSYFLFRGLNKVYWEKLEQAYNQLQTSTDTHPPADSDS